MDGLNVPLLPPARAVSPNDGWPVTSLCQWSAAWQWAASLYTWPVYPAPCTMYHGHPPPPACTPLGFRLNSEIWISYFSPFSLLSVQTGHNFHSSSPQKKEELEFVRSLCERRHHVLLLLWLVVQCRGGSCGWGLGPISRPAGGRAGGGRGVPGPDLLSCPHQAVQCCSTVMADIMSCSIQRRCTFNQK